MYLLPEITQDNGLICEIASLFSEAPPYYKFCDYDVTIRSLKARGTFSPFSFKAIISKSLLNVLQLKGYADMHFQSTAWKEAYYILAIKAMEDWARKLNVKMLTIQTSDEVALEAMLEQDFSEFSVSRTKTMFSASGRKWFDWSNY